MDDRVVVDTVVERRRQIVRLAGLGRQSARVAFLRGLQNLELQWQNAATVVGRTQRCPQGGVDQVGVFARDGGPRVGQGEEHGRRGAEDREDRAHLHEQATELVAQLARVEDAQLGAIDQIRHGVVRCEAEAGRGQAQRADADEFDDLETANHL
ncbi:hypothetical protein KL930_001122 [Ogataea haglerorum]|nr:hypothetical protein KL950_002787 [Ogataea haglerorum]KAG7758158.1 hypothetical protein KL947_002537 [Ogataea haglerorum]KAG7780197.1 hypothetical protein KL922_000548 [Ogataea haglerorum]KAG7781626.1 hypothetical protein KL930_001122 [Ogataea haglerorum]KAG7808839.1 hypothetical protein KL924_002893 [Ogataea haglerorum]